MLRLLVFLSNGSVDVIFKKGDVLLLIVTQIDFCPCRPIFRFFFFSIYFSVQYTVESVKNPVTFGAVLKTGTKSWINIVLMNANQRQSGHVTRNDDAVNGRLAYGAR